MKRIILSITIALLTVLALAACGGQGPTQVGAAPVAREGAPAGVPTPNPVPPGQDGNYAGGYALPAVTTVYVISGTVMAAPGSVQGYEVNGGFSTYRGTGSGYINGGSEGKGILRFTIDKENGVRYFDPYVEAGVTKRAEDWTPLVKDGEFLIIKVEDRKGMGLAEGDHVTLMCREQYEWVMAVATNEIPTTRTLTREIDGCRMIDPGGVTPATVQGR